MSTVYTASPYMVTGDTTVDGDTVSIHHSEHVCMVAAACTNVHLLLVVALVFSLSLCLVNQGRNCQLLWSFVCVTQLILRPLISPLCSAALTQATVKLLIAISTSLFLL
jgi:hypothetical protein